MDFNNKRVQDISQVFDRNWQVNRNNSKRQEFLSGRREHFNRMFNIRDKADMRQEVMRANSVEGQVSNLNERMNATVNGQNRMRMNDLKNNFK